LIIENKIKTKEKEIAAILSELAYFIHPKIIQMIQKKNQDEYEYFKKLFENKIDIKDYLFEGSACVFPGVRRYVSGKGKKKAYNPEYNAIIDDNTFPRHLWCFLSNNKTYNGPNWIETNLNEFELAHLFTHKKDEIAEEKKLFEVVNEDIDPYYNFTCACNVVLLPKGTVRPTDNSNTIRAIFYKRYFDLYKDIKHPMNGREHFKIDIPDWYDKLKWNEPILPFDWEKKIENLLKYRTKRVTELIEKSNKTE